MSFCTKRLSTCTISCFFWVYFLLSFLDIDEYFAYVVPLGMDEILAFCEVFFLSPISNLLCFMTLIHYQNRNEEGCFEMTLVFALVSVTHIE